MSEGRALAQDEPRVVLLLLRATVALSAGAFGVAMALSLVAPTSATDAAQGAAAVAVAVLTVAPILRVLVLAVAWARAGDRRFATLALAVVVVLAAGALAALRARPASGGQ